MYCQYFPNIYKYKVTMYKFFFFKLFWFLIVNGRFYPTIKSAAQSIHHTNSLIFLTFRRLTFFC